jgi:hypothetical protein
MGRLKRASLGVGPVTAARAVTETVLPAALVELVRPAPGGPSRIEAT